MQRLVNFLFSLAIGWGISAGNALGQGMSNPKPGTFSTENGRVSFRSNAPLEVIEAQSKRLKGIIDPSARTFAWVVEVKTFEGFNSPLQREHFNENYLQSNAFPRAYFSGKIIEEIDFGKNGTFDVRAKGRLVIHGVEQERILKGKLEIQGRELKLNARFSVPLTDHQIAIPRIVHQKIAEEIEVAVEASLTLQ